MHFHRFIDYEKELNEEQREVVFFEGGPMLVIAGAGSGKTRVITYRVARLLEKGLSPKNILLLTFTNKAAREMLKRVHELIGIDTSVILGGTFHHVGNLILRHHAQYFGFQRNFTILDNEDAKDLIDLIIKEERLDRGKFPKGEVLKEIFSFFVNREKPTIREAISERVHELIHLEEEIEHIYKLYMERKRLMNLMDFDDLLFYWRRLLLEKEDVRSYYGTLFKHILVDEYQDTNKVQADIIDLLASEMRNVMVVGDDAQSIYSFRGARFENIIEFPLRYPDVKIFKLERNYRSTPQILKFANISISHNKRQFQKNLFSVKKGGSLPIVVSLADKIQEAIFVSEKILSLKKDGIPFSEIAVLYRAHYQSMELQMELTRRAIPFEVRSGLRFFEQAHIKDIVSFLKVMINPLDELSFKRSLKIFPGIGKKQAERIFEALREEEDPIKSLIEAKIQKKVKKLRKEETELLSRIFRALFEAMELRSPSLMIQTLVRELYGEYVIYTFPNPHSRLEDIEELANFANQYDDLEKFLSDLSLIGGFDNDTLFDEEKDRVILSTIHQAKGLEWKVVFIIGCNEGKFPHPKSIEDGNMEEERRLFYVAITRAKDLLFLCYENLSFDRYSSVTLLSPSRFIQEIPDKHYRKITLSNL